MSVFSALAGMSEGARAALCQRGLASFDEPLTAARAVFDEVRKDGDKALLRLCKQYEGGAPAQLFVPDSEIAGAQFGLELETAVRDAMDAISRFARAQLPADVVVKTREGVVCETRHKAIDKVGLYVPGGKASLFSTLLMLAIPARLAGCKDIVVITPRGADGRVDQTVLATARLLGLTQILQVGGAQGIAAVALGTQTVPRVDKIFGPGNRYVTAAKLLATLPPVNVAIDAVAGPSELLVLADESSDVPTVLADLASQVEHGSDSEVVLVSVGEAASARFSAAAQGAQYKWIEAADLQSAIAFVNDYAPEHLSLQLADNDAALAQIRHAGAVFVGKESSVVFGDYAAGTNHTLPTHGSARARGALTTLDFMKSVLVSRALAATPADLIATTVAMANAEGLEAHAAAAAARRP